MLRNSISNFQYVFSSFENANTTTVNLPGHGHWPKLHVKQREVDNVNPEQTLQYHDVGMLP